MSLYRDVTVEFMRLYQISRWNEHISPAIYGTVCKWHNLVFDSTALLWLVESRVEFQFKVSGKTIQIHTKRLQANYIYGEFIDDGNSINQ